MDKNEIIARIERIARCAIHTVGEPPFIMSLDDGIAVREAIDILQRPQRTGHWILCSERLPKYRETVIATNRWHDGVDIVFRDAIQEDGTDDRWVFPLDDDAYCAIEDFIAWMPLPEPYVGERKDNEDS